MPFFPQVEDQCGPASLATMLAARDITVAPEHLRGKVYIPAKQGAVTTEMVAHARQYGLLVYPLGGRYVEIVKEVAAGNPVLVLQNLGFGWAPRWHYSVVIGYDLSRGVVVLPSGSDEAREVGVELFERTWERAGRWAVVMVDPAQLPATVETARFVTAASELEQVGQLEAAARAYAVAMANWPENAPARFGAGNIAYAQGNYPRAIELFDAYLQLRPGSAAGWNNLAFSLVNACCASPGLAAVSCALLLEPADPAFRDSRDELEARVEELTGCQCDTGSRVACPASP